MRIGSRLKSALRTLLHKQQTETELDMELRSYVDAIADEKIASEVPPAEARRQALAECGGLEQVKQAVRDERAGTIVESIFQDVRYGLRQMRHHRAFTWTAVITLGLGIGATPAIFSAVYALLIRPLPYPGSDRLMAISEAWPKDNSYNNPLLAQDFVAAQSSLKSFSSLAGSVYNAYDATSGDQNLVGKGDPLRVKVVGITANFLPLLHVTPAIGRNFLRGEDREGGPAVVLLSHRLWTSKFDGDAGVIGRSITFAGKPWTVVGVLPAHFLFPDPALEPDLYIPADLSASTSLATTELTAAPVTAIGRLRDGVTIAEAQAELNLFERNRVKGYAPFFVGWAEGRRILNEPLQRSLTGDNRRPLLILLACVGAVLLIACTNVANLQLARTVARQHEIALRGALGAGRLRLIRQFLAESLTLAAMASALGLGIAVAATWLIRRGGMPGALSSGLLQAPFGKLSAAVQVNGWVLAFTAGLALLTTILFGLAPAIGASRTDLRTVLQRSGQRISSGRQQRRLRSVLLMAEIGLAVMLLTGAGLLIRSFANALRNDSGFDARQCLTAQIQRNRAATPEKLTDFAQQLLPQLQALPSVREAAITSALPLENKDCTRRVVLGDGPPPPMLAQLQICTVSISPRYFLSAGTPLLQGRPFSDADNADAVPVAIVNQAFARQYFNSDAIGRQFRMNINGRGILTRMTIVGMVEDVRYNGLTASIAPAIYLPFDQRPQNEFDILLRTAVAPGSLATAMRKAVLNVDPDQPLFDIATMEDRMSQSVAQQRLMMLLTAAFAVLAMILAGVGIYGVFAYWVNQRRQELGIRLALGSSRPELVRLIVMQAMRLVLAGSAAGLVGAWFLDRLLASALVGIKVHDPVTFSLAWALMTAIALLGCSLPAMNAAQTDVVSVLQAE